MRRPQFTLSQIMVVIAGMAPVLAFLAYALRKSAEEGNDGPLFQAIHTLSLLGSAYLAVVLLRIYFRDDG